MTRVEVGPGFHLNVEVAGAGEPLVLLHGFTGSAKSWDGLMAALKGKYRFVAVDIVGHGESDAPGDVDHYRMDQVTADIVAAVRLLGIERAAWLGYSMGGRTALSLAAAYPDAVEKLILVGASPGLATQVEREARRTADDALAQRIECEGVPVFTDYWESIPLFESQRNLPEAQRTAIRMGRLANSAVGLANSLRGMGTGVQPFVDVRTVTMPVLALAGSLDQKFTEIGREMAAAMPCGRFETIAGAGHAAHFEQPAACAALIDEFLAISTPTGGHP
jgi:2-succinyl-6-hydroxy-2,4-cyclohexadiene-1-carboxylate synthase